MPCTHGGVGHRIGPGAQGARGAAPPSPPAHTRSRITTGAQTKALHSAAVLRPAVPAVPAVQYQLCKLCKLCQPVAHDRSHVCGISTQCSPSGTTPAQSKHLPARGSVDHAVLTYSRNLWKASAPSDSSQYSHSSVTLGYVACTTVTTTPSSSHKSQLTPGGHKSPGLGVPEVCPGVRHARVGGRLPPQGIVTPGSHKSSTRGGPSLPYHTLPSTGHIDTPR